MKRLAIAVSMLAVGAAGCGSKSPTAPDTLKVFTVQLLPANEVATIGSPENTGKGTAVITIHTDTNTVDFNFSMSGFPSNTTVILAHIHPGAAGVNGGAQIGVTGLSASTPLTLTNGSGTYSVTGVAAAADAATAASRIQAIVAAPQNFYFNVHTVLNPSGVMRGQLQ
jgi:hypothetical protein